MRDIEFRAKSKEKGEWVYGYLVKSDYGNYYITKNLDNFVWIDETTIGEYTGLKDKNGTKIFEGDIINARSEKLIVKCGEFKTESFKTEFPYAKKTKQYGFYAESTKDKEQVLLVKPNGVEVIGNIYDESDVK